MSKKKRRLLGLLLLGMLMVTLIITPACVSYTHLGNVGTPPGPYTIAITGTDANGVTQFGSGGTVVVNVN